MTAMPSPHWSVAVDEWMRATFALDVLADPKHVGKQATPVQLAEIDRATAALRQWLTEIDRAVRQHAERTT